MGFFDNFFKHQSIFCGFVCLKITKMVILVRKSPLFLVDRSKGEKDSVFFLV